MSWTITQQQQLDDDESLVDDSSSSINESSTTSDSSTVVCVQDQSAADDDWMRSAGDCSDTLTSCTELRLMDQEMSRCCVDLQCRRATDGRQFVNDELSLLGERQPQSRSNDKTLVVQAADRRTSRRPSWVSSSDDGGLETRNVNCLIGRRQSSVSSTSSSSTSASTW